MRYDKLPQAERLFDVIGMIDDSIIAEAQAPYTTPSRAIGRKQFRSLIALACAFAIITVGIFGGALLSGLLGTPIADKNDHAAPESSAPSQSVPLDQLLSGASESDAISRVPPQAIDFFDGNVKILWQDLGENEICVLPVPYQGQAQRIRNLLKQQTDSIPPDHTDPLSCQVWIAFEDGTVVSPYLKDSPGNIGYADLFAYAPEVEPSPDLIRLIDELLPPS